MSAGSYLDRIDRLSFTRANPGRVPTTVLVGLVLLIGVLASSWALATTATRNDLDHADFRLAAIARSAQAAFTAEVAKADARAGAVAASRRLQQALVAGDVAAIESIARGRSVAVYRGARLLTGSPPGHAVTRSVVVSRGGRPIGRVVGYVALDDALLRRLDRTIELSAPDRLFIRFAPSGPPDRAVDRMIGGRRFRTYAVDLVAPPNSAVLVAATPRSVATRRSRRFALWGTIALLTTFATLCVAAYAIVSARRGRVAARADADDARALGLVGDALASTHNPDRLLPIILHAAMQATGAPGGQVLQGDRELAREGAISAGAAPLLLDLQGEGDVSERTTLALYPPARGFDDRTKALAQSLAAQATIALENAHLHVVVKRQAVTDELTGLANRRAFMDTLEQELTRAERFGGPLALIFADLDDFKRVNDRFGHGVGDDVLRTFADILRGRTRLIDLSARLGGEEFAILLPGTDVAGAMSLAESLRSAVASLQIAARGTDSVSVTASFGVAAFPETHSADDLLTAADLALYSAKAEGKNRVATIRQALDTATE